MNNSTWRFAIVTLLIALVLLGVAYVAHDLLQSIHQRYNQEGARPPTVTTLVSNLAALILMPILIALAYFLRERSAETDSGSTGFSLNLLGVVLGTTLGWGLAVVWVPFDEADGAIYSKVGATVTAFLSGFVVSYVHPLVQGQLASRPQAFLVQIGLGVSALIITGLTIATNRTEYLQTQRDGHLEEAVVAARERAEIEAVKARYAEEYKKAKEKPFQGSSCAGCAPR